MSIISSFLMVKEYSSEKAIRVSGISQYAKAPLAEMVNNGRCHVYAIVVLNKILGRIVLITDSEDKELADGENVCYFSNLWVHPRLRGKKLGTKLVKHVEKEAKKKGFKYLTLGVRKDNEKNVSIYKHLGFDEFVKNKSQDVVVKDKNGNFITVKEYAVLMKKL